MEHYKVTCLKCGKSDTVLVDPDKKIVFEGMMQTPFMSARWRADENWGFECSCGNDSRISKKEERFLDQLVQGTPQGIEQIRASLKIADNKKFDMRAI